MRAQIAHLSQRERREKSRVLLRDTAALGVLSGLVVVLSFMTYALFHSFAAHRHMLEQRWQGRAEAALAQGHPEAAINDLHSALAFASEDRAADYHALEVELAMSLASAGRIQEAQTYFRTLLEVEPGSGIINLQLARLAVRLGNTQNAIDYYQASIDGTWNGDGYVRRRQIRLELARMLIDKSLLPEARNQLLVAAGNAPEDHALQLQVADLLLTAADPNDAMDLYKRAARTRVVRLQALEGEARAAISLGRYLEAHTFLDAAVGESSFRNQPAPLQAAVRGELDQANRILALYPAPNLPVWVQAQRIAAVAQLAMNRLQACSSKYGTPAAAPLSAVPAATAPVTALSPATSAAPAAGTVATNNGQQRALLTGLAAHLQQLNPLKRFSSETTPAAPNAGNPAQQIASLAARWAALPAGPALVKQLATNPDLAQSTIGLVYATEQATALTCGPPDGDDVLLLQIAKAPDQVEAVQ